MDGKRDCRRRITADVLFAACYDFPSCAVIYAVTLVWVADRRSIRCHNLCFTPFAPLRAILAGFFQIIMLNGNAVLHICICLLLSAALSLGGLVVLKRKTL